MLNKKMFPLKCYAAFKKELPSPAMMVLVLSSLLVAALVTAENNDAPFGGRSFSVLSTVHIHTFGSELLMSRVFESYSIEQKRARIEYETINDQHDNDESGIFFIDSTRKIAIEYDSTDECKLTNINLIQETLNVRPLEDKDDPVADDYIAGPARMLFFVKKHSDRMKLTPIESELKIRNIKCLLYVIEYANDHGKYHIEVFYSEFSQTSVDGKASRQQQLSSQKIPMQISITELDENLAGKQTTVIDYSQFELLSEGSLMRLERRHHDDDGDVIFDEFTFLPGMGFSKELYEKEIDVFSGRPANSVKFSFKAKIEFQFADDKAPLEIKAFVAYDAKLASMRYDVYGNSLYSEPTSGIKSQVFNFKSDRMYHAIQRAPTSSVRTIFDKVLELSDGLDNKIGSKTETTQCMVARIGSDNVRPISQAIGDLLVGATKFVYMGQAQVRGIEAKVFEASEGSLPFWLDQPMVYMSKSQEWKLRMPEVGLRPPLNSNNKIIKNIVLYFGEKDANHPLLLVEIYRLHKRTNEELMKQTIHFYDFVWDLTESPAGDRVSDLFSLADICFEDSKYYAKIDMLLESNQLASQPTTANTALEISDSRNLALIGAIQDEFSLPATMIYDVESKLIKSNGRRKSTNNNNNNTNETLALLASFKFASHTESLADMVYLGQGRLNSQYTGQQMSKLYIRSFQSCFFLASHCRADIVFGYNLESHKCYLDLNPNAVSPDTTKTSESAFVLDQNRSMEIYRINHRANFKHSILIDWIKGTHKKDDPNENLKFLGRKLKLRGIEQPSTGDGIEFTVKRIQKKVGINNSDNDDDDDDENNEGDDNFGLVTKLIGFGLIENEPGNRRVRASTLGDYNWAPINQQSSKLEDDSSMMTYDQCHAACLSDFDCQSFSVCVKDGELECIVSKTNFNSPNVIKKLAEIHRKRKNSGIVGRKRNELDVEIGNNETVKLSLHLNCELHNKDFIELFKDRQYAEQTFTNRRVYPVRSISECAEKCFYQTLKALSGNIHQAKEFFSKLNPNQSGDNDDALHNLVFKHKEAVRELCRVFYYRSADRLTNEDFAEDVIEHILSKDQIETKPEGYCMLNSRRSDNETQELIKAGKFRPKISKNSYMFLEMYDFKADFLYEKQYGVSLRQSPMRAEVQEAYRTALEATFKKGKNVSEQSVSILKSFIEGGNNIQEYLKGMEQTSSKCALVCFIQTQGPWPACRSFDIILRLEDNNHILECHLNSITLQQAKSSERFDLIEDNTNNLQMWHYEPRSGFILDESILSGEISLVEENFWAKLSTHSTGIRLHGFVTFLLIIFGIIGGVFIGVKIGQNIVNKKLATQRAHNIDKEILVGPTSIEFSNQVNSEGLIDTN